MSRRRKEVRRWITGDGSKRLAGRLRSLDDQPDAAQSDRPPEPRFAETQGQAEASRADQLQHRPEAVSSVGAGRAFPDTTQPEEAWRYLREGPDYLPERSNRRVSQWMRSHPGPQCQLSPEALFLGIFLTADKLNRYHRADACSIINGLDATMLHHLGLCDGKGRARFEPISYSTVQKQFRRLEQDVPFRRDRATDERGHGRTRARPHPTLTRRADLLPWTDESDGADPGLLWFNIDVLLATVTDEFLAKVTAGAMDATAFETSGRTRDFRVQKEVDRAIRKMLEAGKEFPGDVMLGPDGKLVRCPSDPQARGSVRSASSETGFVKKWFAGYFVTSLAVSQDYKWSGDPTKVHLSEDLGPLTLAFSTAPATRDKGPIARDVTAAIKQLLPQLRLMTADREFTEKRESFVKPLHDQDIAVIMDYKRPFVEKFDIVTLPNGELVYETCGDHFPLWMPQEFLGAPDASLTEEEKHDWYERRAAYRYSSNGLLKNGKVQKICPQCAGRVIYAEKTRMGKYRDDPHPDSALSFGLPFAAGYCCRGSVILSGDDLGKWQPIPWGTRAQAKLYNAGRSRIENTYNLAKEDGAISKKALPSAWHRTPKHGVPGYAGRKQRPAHGGRIQHRPPAGRHHAPSGSISVLCGACLHQRQRQHRSDLP